MWNQKNLLDFKHYVQDLLNDEQVQKMRYIEQHVEGIDCFDHSLFVAYLSFIICRKLRLNERAAARGGLLHDLYLCDWNTTTVGLFERLLIHPAMALKNARPYGLSALEEDIILTHMWPVTLRKIPRHWESWVVNFADKVCTISEVCRVYHYAKVHQRLQPETVKKRL